MAAIDTTFQRNVSKAEENLRVMEKLQTQEEKLQKQEEKKRKLDETGNWRFLGTLK